MTRHENFESREIAHRVCLELWDTLLVRVKEGSYQYDMGDEDEKLQDYFDIVWAKDTILLELGYENVAYGCPMCDFYKNVRDDAKRKGCESCPLNFCCENGYEDVMRLEEVEKFTAFVHERIAVAERKNARQKFIDGWLYFCKKVNFGQSALDAEAITFMNTFVRQLDEAIKEGDVYSVMEGETDG